MRALLDVNVVIALLDPTMCSMSGRTIGGREMQNQDGQAVPSWKMASFASCRIRLQPAHAFCPGRFDFKITNIFQADRSQILAG